MKWSLAILIILWALPALATEERAALGVSEAYPLIEKPLQILVSHPTYPDLTQFQVKAIYRPNSIRQFEKVIGHPDENGRLAWTPLEAGVCLIQAVAPDTENSQHTVNIFQRVAVRYGTFPNPGLWVMLATVITLFGGLAFSLTKFKEKSL